MKEPKYDVYRLEVFEPVHQSAWGGTFGGALMVDVLIPDFDVLRKNVYEAMMNNCGYLHITHLGERRLVTTCAQFEAEYGRGMGN